MSAEIVDYFLIFWVVLAAAVFVIGNIYDKQQQEKRRKIQQQEARRARLEQDPWAPPSSSSSLPSSQTTYSSLAAANYSSQAHQYQQTASGQLDAYRGQSHLPLQSQRQQAPLGGYHHQRAVLLDDADEEEEERRLRRARRSAPDYADAGDTATERASIPTASGFNADCVEWVNAILYLFYANSDKYGPVIGENVYRSLNEKLSSLISASSEHSHLLVEFEGVNANSSTQPELTNVRTESESDKSVSATCKIYNRRISLNLSIRRLHGGGSSGGGGGGGGGGGSDPDGDEQVTRYELVLENLEGKLKSMAMLNEKLIVIQFIEKPDTKILLRPLTIIRLGRGPPREPLISEDALVQLILQTLTQVVVDLYFGNDLDFPQYRHHHHHHSSGSTYANYKNKLNSLIKGSASELKRQIKSDFFGNLVASEAHGAKERKVFVKIIKAKNINYNQSVTCLLELEAPRQQAVSSTKQGSEPFWDEDFLFNISDKSTELTLELWDSLSAQALAAAASAAASASVSTAAGLAPDTPTSSLKRPAGKSHQAKWHKADLTAGGKFLGRARVSVAELRQNPVQKVSLALQPQVANDDPSNSVGGELQLELLFMEHSAEPRHASDWPGAAHQSTGGVLAPATLQKSNSTSSLARYQPGDIVSVDRKLTPSGFVITTTTITKAPREPRQHQQVRARDQLLAARNQSPAGSSSVNTELSLDEAANLDPITGRTATPSESASRRAGQPDGRSVTGADSTTGPGPGRVSRSRSRSRSFIRAIRKRLSFSRTRSRSVGESAGGAESPRVLDEPEFGSRSRASSEASAGVPSGARAKSMPASRDPSEVPTIVINKGGRLSDTAASAFTFTHPKSQLVIEVVEPGLREEGAGAARDHVRHYAVPDDAASQRKWRKRGTKLHVFNEHQFVACHLAGSSTCHLCGRVFSRRPGKQGYKCRNCHLLSHKECHVKVDHICPYAQRDGLRLEYIDADPPAQLVDEMMHCGGAATGAAHSDLQGQCEPARRRPARPGRSGLKSAVKSISMEVDDR